jgi:hypothetical protein
VALAALHSNGALHLGQVFVSDLIIDVIRDLRAGEFFDDPSFAG